jgi:putative PIN family toxin of toxin-antitoxin system
MSVFLDTNILVSAVATRGLCADVLRETLLSHQLLVSAYLLRELEMVLREKIGLPQPLLSEFMEFIQKDAHSSRSSPMHKIPVEDEADIPILSAALDAKADVFVTGDRGLIELERIGNMEIVSPRGFWEKLKSSISCAKAPLK